MKRANDIFEAALGKIESRPVRAWASSPHTKACLLGFIQSDPVAEKEATKDVYWLSTFILATAMGL